mgnify:CR=1 FL=1
MGRMLWYVVTAWTGLSLLVGPVVGTCLARASGPSVRLLPVDPSYPERLPA